ncbi:NAD(P)-dependent oxidoreductase [Alkalicella caledoniensis]|uniref:NAD(P)-dependent oxidoreductase n=1 Tax=Alkalicella caledoniensis TaxID=2731377 RepID=A0A7G9WB29_ALKCA|nr:NAD(P)-dependent oxidoreductase [Alkalicella caledoniensis]QNO15891.1 NAD(P)-dependent oxidoreductase [Alkalicella caledoniensis]
MRIGFIGLGAMGKGMATNLVKSVNQLVVYDINIAVVNELKELGAEVAKSPKDLAEKVDVIMTSLPNSQIVQMTMLGENGVLEGAKPGSVIVDFSSITPKTIQHIAREANKKDIEVLDAPVSGGQIGAEKGTLTIMVGGKEEVLNKILPLLNCVGTSIKHVGDVGAGDTIKLVNNLLLGVNMAAVSEALTLGVKAGLKPEILYDVISQSSGNSYALKAKYEKFIAKGNFEPGFMIDLQYKDLQLAIDTAKDLQFPLLIGNLAQQLYEIARAEGNGNKDISAIINTFENWGQVKVREREAE